MMTIEDIRLALNYLSDGFILTSNGLDFFVLRKDRIHHYENGTHFSLTKDEFKTIYNKTIFKIVEDSIQIDENKDEEYYRYYRK